MLLSSGEPPIAVRVTVLRYGMPTDLRIEIGDKTVGNQLKKQLLEIAAKHKKDADAELQHSQTYREIDRILAGYGLTYDDVRHLGKPLPRPAIEKLMTLCEKAPSGTAMGIHILLTEVARPDREFVARWLVEEFKKPRASDQLGVRIYDIAVPAIGDELVKIIENRRFGRRRGSICMALAKVKHKRAAEVIASVLEEDGCTIWAIRCLAKLKATQYVDDIRKYLRDRDSDVRREAKKTLNKLGFAVDPPPPPVHVVTGRRSVPQGPRRMVDQPRPRRTGVDPQVALPLHHQRIRRRRSRRSRGRRRGTAGGKNQGPPFSHHGSRQEERPLVGHLHGR